MAVFLHDNFDGSWTLKSHIEEDLSGESPLSISDLTISELNQTTVTVQFSVHFDTLDIQRFYEILRENLRLTLEEYKSLTLEDYNESNGCGKPVELHNGHVSVFPMYPTKKDTVARFYALCDDCFPKDIHGNRAIVDLYVLKAEKPVFCGEVSVGRKDERMFLCED